MPMARRSDEHSVGRAEPAVIGGSILGAQVVRMTHDDAGEFGEPEYLCKFGRVRETD